MCVCVCVCVRVRVCVREPSKSFCTVGGGLSESLSRASGRPPEPVEGLHRGERALGESRRAAGEPLDGIKELLEGLRRASESLRRASGGPWGSLWRASGEPVESAPDDLFFPASLWTAFGEFACTSETLLRPPE
eukprot:10305593-Alexandrium_andersonii.AAC.1